MKERKKLKEWREYPLGTKVYAEMGGYWERVSSGWKWFGGSTFPTPGADWLYTEEPAA
jgi:hypothetical protein